MMNQEQLLRGGAALFNLNGTVSGEQWRAYVGGIKLDGAPRAFLAWAIRKEFRLAR